MSRNQNNDVIGKCADDVNNYYARMIENADDHLSGGSDGTRKSGTDGEVTASMATCNNDVKMPFSCSICCRTFSLKFSLKRHLMKIHGLSGMMSYSMSR